MNIISNANDRYYKKDPTYLLPAPYSQEIPIPTEASSPTVGPDLTCGLLALILQPSLY